MYLARTAALAATVRAAAVTGAEAQELVVESGLELRVPVRDNDQSIECRPNNEVEENHRGQDTN